MSTSSKTRKQRSDKGQSRGFYGMRGENLKIRQSLMDVIRKRKGNFTVADLQSRMQSDEDRLRLYFVLYGLQREGRVQKVSRGTFHYVKASA